MDVEQHRTGGVGDIRHVHFPAGELPYQPAVHRAEAQLAGKGLFTRAGHVVQDPLDLGAGEIRIDDKTRLFPDLVHQALRLQLITEGRCTPVLPHNGIVHGNAGLGIPHDGGFSLVGNADGGEALAVDAQLGDGLGNDGGLGGPDFHRIVFHPARFREILGKLHLGHRADVALVVKDNGPGGTGALVQRQNVLASS